MAQAKMAQPQTTQPKDNCFWALVYGFLALIVLGGIYDYKYTPHHPNEDAQKQQSRLQESLRLSESLQNEPLLKTVSLLPKKFGATQDLPARSLPAGDITTGTILAPKRSHLSQGQTLKANEFKAHLMRLKTPSLQKNTYKSDALSGSDLEDEIFISTQVKRAFSFNKGRAQLGDENTRTPKKISFAGQTQLLVGATQMPKFKRSYHQSHSQDLLSLPQCQHELNALLLEQPVQFASGQYRASRHAYKRLRHIAKRLANCDFSKIVIEGHSDKNGNEHLNKQLSSKRAVHIGHLLVRFGVQHYKLKAIGFGASRPLAPNDSAANRARNRRITIRLL